MRQIIKNKNSGLTLMGVIFAIGIVLVGLMGILSLFRYVIFMGRISGDRFIATNLASEGIEIVRAMRDDNWKNGRQWNNGLGAGEYQGDYNDGALVSTGVSPLAPIKIDTTGYYSYDNGQNSKYTRRVIIYPDNTATFCLDDTSTGDNDNICVFSEVTWQAMGVSYAATVADRLYNWK